MLDYFQLLLGSQVLHVQHVVQVHGLLQTQLLASTAMLVPGLHGLEPLLLRNALLLTLESGPLILELLLLVLEETAMLVYGLPLSVQQAAHNVAVVRQVRSPFQVHRHVQAVTRGLGHLRRKLAVYPNVCSATLALGLHLLAPA